MKPWLILAGDFVRTGGMDAANFALAGHLARSGRETHLVAHRVDPELAALRGIRVHRVPRPFGSHLLGFPLLDRAARLQAAFHSGALPRHGRPARGLVTLANGGNFPGAATWLHYVHAACRPEIAGRRLRRWVERAARWQALRAERRVASRARAVIANSALTARHAVELLGADPARVHTVYYGADPERFRPPSADERAAARRALRLDRDAPALVFVGALGDRRKGFDTLFQAFAFLASTEPGWDATLLVAGAGGELEEWKRRAVAARLGQRIRFLGFRDDMREVLFAGDGVVSPTRYEAYGLAVQEALCTGLPAVVSAGAGVAERIPAPLRALLLDDPEDAGELAERLLAWRAGLQAHRAAALALSEALRGWTWDHMAARIVDIVERAA
ncbi:MAG TPA: glycosyltransferase family 4 protein [Longimicrobium sp.]|jgi:glycosyltransferase involved in cell wall biosynthesis|nr:glycosyltransferase family 4 protein [Longimicrobium sp.]